LIARVIHAVQTGDQVVDVCGVRPKGVARHSRGNGRRSPFRTDFPVIQQISLTFSQ
jgi:hypothetical protein